MFSSCISVSLSLSLSLSLSPPSPLSRMRIKQVFMKNMLYLGIQQLFNICVYYKMITMINLVSIPHHSQLQNFLSCNENFQDLLSQQLSNTVLLTIVAMLSMLMTSFFYNWKFVLFGHHHPFSPLHNQSVLCIGEPVFFFFLINFKSPHISEIIWYLSFSLADLFQLT